MFKLQISFINPIMNDSETVTYQFDPATLDQAQWGAGFLLAKEAIDKLVSRSSAEPQEWTVAATTAVAAATGAATVAG